MGQKQGRPPAPTLAEPLDGADGGGVESDESMEEESTAESVTEDEFAQFPDTAEEKDGRAEEEETTPWNRDAREAGHDEGETTIRHRGIRCRKNHTSGNFLEDRQMHVVRTNQGSQLSGALQGSQISANQAKRKAKSDARNRARNNKRARKPTSSGSYQNQRELQLLVGGGPPTQATNTAVPWEHRGILGHTRKGRLGDSEERS